MGSSYDWHNWPKCGQIDLAIVPAAREMSLSGGIYWFKEAADPTGRMPVGAEVCR